MHSQDSNVKPKAMTIIRIKIEFPYFHGDTVSNNPRSKLYVQAPGKAAIEASEEKIVGTMNIKILLKSQLGRLRSSCQC